MEGKQIHGVHFGGGERVPIVDTSADFLGSPDFKRFREALARLDVRFDPVSEGFTAERPKPSGAEPAAVCPPYLAETLEAVAALGSLLRRTARNYKTTPENPVRVLWLMARVLPTHAFADAALERRDEVRLWLLSRGAAGLADAFNEKVEAFLKRLYECQYSVYMDACEMDEGNQTEKSRDALLMLAEEAGETLGDLASFLRKMVSLADAAPTEGTTHAGAVVPHGACRGKRRRRRPPLERNPRPLTARQTEVMQLYGELKGSIGAVAKRLGRDPKTVRECLEAAHRKLGDAGWRNRERRGQFKAGRKLPTDQRGQVNV